MDLLFCLIVDWFSFLLFFLSLYLCSIYLSCVIFFFTLLSSLHHPLILLLYIILIPHLIPRPYIIFFPVSYHFLHRIICFAARTVGSGELLERAQNALSANAVAQLREGGWKWCRGVGWDWISCCLLLFYVMFTRQHDAISQGCMLYYIIFLHFTLHHL